MYGCTLHFVAEKSRSNWSHELQRIRKDLRFTQARMAELIGANFEQYRGWEYRNEPPQWAMEKARSMTVNLKPVAASAMGPIRYAGTIGAGPAPDGHIDEDLLWVPLQYTGADRAAFVLPSDAFSALPYLQPGDTLVFREGINGLNKFVAARLRDGEQLVCKLLIYENGSPKLRSPNPNYPDIEMEDVQLVGVLIGIISPDGEVMIGPYLSGIDPQYIDSRLRGRLL